MKYLFTLTFSLLIFSIGIAQQTAQYSMYMLNKFNYNPAYAGLDNSLSITGVYRQQWAGLPGSPTSQAINAHAPFYFASGGIGLAFENENLGSWQHTSINLAYDYQMDIGRAGILSIGLSGGIVQRSLDGSKLRTPEGEYLFSPDETLIVHNDDLLPNGEIAGISPNFNFGIYFQTEKFETGVSAINLTEPVVDLDGNLKFKLNRNYYFSAGYNIDIGKKLNLRPSVLLKSNTIETQIDFSALLKYNDNIFLGGSFRGYNSDSRDAVALILGFNLSEKITVSYAYDLTLSDLSTVNDGSHEIMFNYNLGKIIGKGKLPRIIYNPRNL